jgi:hypothetical protein
MFLDLSELSGKHLQLLKEIIPRTSRVAVLGDLDINAPQLRELALVARSLALETQAVEFKNATNLDGAFDAAKSWGSDDDHEREHFIRLRDAWITVANRISSVERPLISTDEGDLIAAEVRLVADRGL